MITLAFIISLASAFSLGAFQALLTIVEEGSKAKIFTIVSAIISILLFSLAFWLAASWS